MVLCDLTVQFSCDLMVQYDGFDGPFPFDGPVSCFLFFFGCFI